jgi:hypothetical protein
MTEGYYKWVCGCVYYFKDIEGDKLSWRFIAVCQGDKHMINYRGFVYQGVCSGNIEKFRSKYSPISKKEAAIARMKWGGINESV